MAICGPSSAESAIEGQTQSLASSMMSDFQERYGAQSAVLQQLNDAYAPVVAAGPSQTGFSAEELAARNTAAINASGAAATHAQQFASNAMAGQGGEFGTPGGTSGLESGIQQQIKASIASEQAGNLGAEQNKIIAQNYATGRQNYQQATAGMQALTGAYSPTPFSSGAETGLGTAFGESNQINTQQQAGAKALLNAGLDVAGSLSGGFSNLAAGGALAGSETGGGVEQFLSGMTS